MTSLYEFTALYLKASPEVKKAIARILEHDKDAPPLTQNDVRKISNESGVSPELFEEVSNDMKARGYWS
jgi:hypothetical protein